jgi:16S rRNA C967 or C1407 C5-methylase (RsmB/RsmF family)
MGLGFGLKRSLCLQEAALRHALTFPAATRVAYSTCSVHREENEDVIAAMLGDAEEAGFHLVVSGGTFRASVCLGKVSFSQI